MPPKKRIDTSSQVVRKLTFQEAYMIIHHMIYGLTDIGKNLQKYALDYGNPDRNTTEVPTKLNPDNPILPWLNAYGDNGYNYARNNMTGLVSHLSPHTSEKEFFPGSPAYSSVCFYVLHSAMQKLFPKSMKTWDNFAKTSVQNVDQFYVAPPDYDQMFETDYGGRICLTMLGQRPAHRPITIRPGTGDVLYISYRARSGHICVKNQKKICTGYSDKLELCPIWDKMISDFNKCGVVSAQLVPCVREILADPKFTNAVGEIVPTDVYVLRVAGTIVPKTRITANCPPINVSLDRTTGIEVFGEVVYQGDGGSTLVVFEKPPTAKDSTINKIHSKITTKKAAKKTKLTAVPQTKGSSDAFECPFCGESEKGVKIYSCAVCGYRVCLLCAVNMARAVPIGGQRPRCFGSLPSGDHCSATIDYPDIISQFTLTGKLRKQVEQRIFGEKMLIDRNAEYAKCRQNLTNIPLNIRIRSAWGEFFSPIHTDATYSKISKMLIVILGVATANRYFTDSGMDYAMMSMLQGKLGRIIDFIRTDDRIMFLIKSASSIAKPGRKTFCGNTHCTNLGKKSKDSAEEKFLDEYDTEYVEFEEPLSGSDLWYIITLWYSTAKWGSYTIQQRAPEAFLDTVHVHSRAARCSLENITVPHVENMMGDEYEFKEPDGYADKLWTMADHIDQLLENLPTPKVDSCDPKICTGLNKIYDTWGIPIDKLVPKLDLFKQHFRQQRKHDGPRGQRHARDVENLEGGNGASPNVASQPESREIKPIPSDVQQELNALKRNGISAQACPGCLAIVIKDYGCAQMYCVSCGAKYDHNTREYITGFFHNPEYFATLARNNEGTHYAVNVNSMQVYIDEKIMRMLDSVKPRQVQANIFSSSIDTYMKHAYMACRAVNATSIFNGIISGARLACQNETATVAQAIVEFEKAKSLFVTYASLFDGAIMKKLADDVLTELQKHDGSKLLRETTRPNRGQESQERVSDENPTLPVTDIWGNPVVDTTATDRFNRFVAMMNGEPDSGDEEAPAQPRRRRR